MEVNEVELIINKRNRDFGLVTWPLSKDFEMKSLLGLKTDIHIELNGKSFDRKVSYRYRRFSIGKGRIKKLGEVNCFVLSRIGNKIILKAK